MLNERNTLLEDDGIEEEILVEEECSVAQAVWGDILGNIENQTDLKNALDAKQDSLTEAQLNAVNSGITSEKVATYDGYADQIASKADQSALNAESTARGEADTALGTRIDNEALARQSADNGLQTQIDAITSKSDVVDVVANYAALQAYDTSTLGNNDVVKVLDDETHEDALTYYRWSTTTQTWSYIGQEAPYYSKGQMDVKLAEKQDKLTAGANIQIENGVISATDTTYTAGNGLNLNGTEFSADTDILATKEDLEGYYTKPETDNLLAPKLEAEVVAELPTTGTEGKLYLTPKAHTTSTATGNPIEATVTEQAGQLESFQLDGDTFQQTYTGKNLVGIDGITFPFTTNGVTVTREQDGSYTFNGTTTGVTNFVLSSYSNRETYGSLVAYDGQNVTLSLATSGTMQATQSTSAPAARNYGIKTWSGDDVFVATNDGTNFSPSRSGTLNMGSYTDAYLGVRISNGVILQNFNMKIQLELGSTATSYEPYVGGQPSPNPDYPQPIQTVTGEQTIRVCGLNIYDKSKDLVGYALTGNGIETALPAWHISDYIPVVGGETYTVTGMTTPGGTARTCYYDSAKNLIEAVPQQISPYTITPPSGSAYVRLSIYNTAQIADSNTLQIELGSTAHNYEAYSGTNYPLDLGSIELCKLDTYQDYIYKDGDSWKVHKATNKIVADGSENWQYPDSGANYTFFQFSRNNFRAKYGNAADFYASTTEVGFAKADKFEQIVATAANMKTEQGIGFTTEGSGWFRISVANTIATTVDAFKTWLSSHSTTIDYALATPTDTTITDQTLIAQLEAIRTASLENGANTITNTATGSNLAGDMEIGYYGFNPRNRYDKWLWLDINNEYEQIGS